jgi:hypothetical protein
VHPDAEDVIAIASAVQQARARIISPDAVEVPTNFPTVVQELAVVARKQ